MLPGMFRLEAQVEFLLTCDRLKEVTRTTLLHSGARAENSAEHSWHLALTALTLGEYAPPGRNSRPARVPKPALRVPWTLYSRCC